MTEVVALVLAIVALAVVGPHAIFDQQVIQVFGVQCSAIVARAGCAIMACGGLNTRLGCASGGIGDFCLAWVASGGGHGGVLDGRNCVRDVEARADTFVVIAMVGLSNACRRWVDDWGNPYVHGCVTLTFAHQRAGKTVVSCRSGFCW